MTADVAAIVERLFKAAIFVPVLGLVAWWLFTSWLDRLITLQELAAGLGLLAGALFAGVALIVRGGWGFLGVIALVYLALVALAAWEYIYWRKHERERLLAEIEKYQEAAVDDPHNAAAHSFLGAAHLQLGNFEEAQAALEKAVELDPDSSRDRALLERARNRQPRVPKRWAE